MVAAAADLGPLADPRSQGGVEVTGEHVDRLVVVVVGVEHRVPELLHVVHWSLLCPAGFASSLVVGGRRSTGKAVRMGRPPHPDAKPWPDLHRPTSFQAAVVAAVEALEPGELVTFSEVAEQIGRPGGGQAVANVLRGAPDLPWWRVLPSDGRVYPNLATAQVPLLRAEGHVVDEHERPPLALSLSATHVQYAAC